MNNDPAATTGKKVTGSVKEAIGKLTGDTKLQAEGKADRMSDVPPTASERPAGTP